MGDTEHLLRGLLAVVHRDGGHYFYEHGMEKSVEDAIKIVAGLIHGRRRPETWHGCFTGDCPHETANDCIRALRVYVAELEAEAGIDWGLKL